MPALFSGHIVPNIFRCMSYVPKFDSTQSFVVLQPAVMVCSRARLPKAFSPSWEVSHVEIASFLSWHFARAAFAMSCASSIALAVACTLPAARARTCAATMTDAWHSLGKQAQRRRTGRPLATRSASSSIAWRRSTSARSPY
eukprot:scaffold13666_cov109-Isochrysis_galbana.AAC.4